MSTNTKFQNPDCEPDPDIGGLGILVSFTILAILTLIFSTVALWAPHLAKNRQGSRIANGNNPDSDQNPGRLDKIAKPGDTMALSQVALSLALLTSTFITYRDRLGDPHALLAATLSLLAVCSALQVFIPNKTRLSSRQCKLMLLLGFVILPLMISLVAIGEQGPSILALGAVMILSIGGFLVVKIMIKKGRGVRKFYAFITLEAAFCTVWLVVYAFKQKHEDWVRYGTDVHCTMSTPEENAWSFGQTAAVLMVAAPLLDFASSMIEVKCEKAANDELKNVELGEGSGYDVLHNCW